MDQSYTIYFERDNVAPFPKGLQWILFYGKALEISMLLKALLSMLSMLLKALLSMFWKLCYQCYGCYWKLYQCFESFVINVMDVIESLINVTDVIEKIPSIPAEFAQDTHPSKSPWPKIKSIATAVQKILLEPRELENFWFFGFLRSFMIVIKW